jgi:hypothetical protein
MPLLVHPCCDQMTAAEDSLHRHGHHVACPAVALVRQIASLWRQQAGAGSMPGTAVSLHAELLQLRPEYHQARAALVEAGLVEPDKPGLCLTIAAIVIAAERMS